MEKIVIEWIANELVDGEVIAVNKKREVYSLREARNLITEIRSRPSLVGSNHALGACSAPVMSVEES